MVWNRLAKRLAAAALGAGLAVMLAAGAARTYWLDEYHRYLSPDRRHTLIVLSHKFPDAFLPTGPGDGGGRAAIGRLIDENGRVLREEHLRFDGQPLMLWEIAPAWEAHSVRVHSFLEPWSF
jgi:hypothetical protein